MTSKELARLLGVSQSTISRALNNSPQIPVGTKEMIRLKAKELGFELNSQARSLRTSRTGTIGVLLPKSFKSMLDNMMMANLYDHIQEKLIENDYDVLTVYDYVPREKTSVLERMIRRRKIDGLILCREELCDKERALIRSHNFPCVSMLDVSSLRDTRHYSISDSEYGGFLAGEFLGRSAGSEMMFVAAEEDPANSGKRRRGFVRGLKKSGRALPAANSFVCGRSFQSAYDFGLRLGGGLAGRRIAVLAYNDVVGMALVHAFVSLGVDVPGQAQVIGMDDIPMTVWMKPHLSTLSVPIDDIVDTGCRILRNLIEGKNTDGQNVVYKPKLILRDTTIPPS